MKDFKIAEIVPVSHLEDIAKNHYHMCLAHVVKQSKEYAEFYKRMSQEGKYVLMDNGAAENSQLQPEELLSMYDIIKPTEIVIPDTLCNSQATIAKCVEFCERYADLPYKFMAVPQGRNLDEWSECALQMIQNERVNSIGISKFLNIVTKDMYARKKAVSSIEYFVEKYHRRDIEVHLLGCEEGPKIVRTIQKGSTLVRGCDSAFAYIAAKAGVTSIDNSTTRPVGTIDFIDGKYIKNTKKLLSQFEMTAGVINNGSWLRWR